MAVTLLLLLLLLLMMIAMNMTIMTLVMFTVLINGVHSPTTISNKPFIQSCLLYTVQTFKIRRSKNISLTKSSPL